MRAPGIAVILKCVLLSAGAAVAMLGGAHATLAHHSYAMFDRSKKLTVSGTVARLEWMNPHTFVWLYVPSRSTLGKHDLYAFENGSINSLTRIGWTSTTLKAGDKITVEYWPLVDGRMGGHFDKATRPDGSVLFGAGPGASAGRAPHPALDLPGAQQPQKP